MSGRRVFSAGAAFGLGPGESGVVFEDRGAFFDSIGHFFADDRSSLGLAFPKRG